MVRTSTSVRILCVVVLMMCAAGSGRAGGVPPLIISEFRLRGPGGATDEFIEIYNRDGLAHTVASASSKGYGIAASDGVTRCTIPNGTVIPQYGHFLCVNSSGYSLGGVPAGSGSSAVGDATYTLDVPDNAGIALFNNNTGGTSYSLGNRVDAVGSRSETNALYREASGYQSLPVPLPLQAAWVRLTNGSCASATCTAQSSPVSADGFVDSDNNESDFYYTNTTGSISIADGRVQRLGAPGPQNLSSPAYQWGGYVAPSKVSGCSPSDMPPNRVRDLTPGPATTSPLGTLELRVKWTNSGGADITRLRFRVVDLTIWPVPFGTADLRVLSSDGGAITVDNYPCGTSDGGDLLAGTTLEAPAQPGGGGLNSALSVAAVSPATPFAIGGRINVRFKLGVAQTGFARFCVIPETTPTLPVDPWCYIGSTQALPRRPTPGDYDFDGLADMVTQNPARQWWTIDESSDGHNGVVRLVGFGANGTPVPGDYDGDGRYDPAIYQRATGTWIVIFSRTGRFGTVEGRGGAAFEPVPGDYDGDGTTDLAVVSATQNIWRFWPSSGPSGAAPVDRDFGGAGETPVAGLDFDGDGLSDMTLYNPRTGVWRHRTSSSNFTATVSQLFTAPGATLVPGDYDGDRRADYGVYERGTGTWRILLSGGATPYMGPPETGTWGGPGFVPVPADYDGDGRMDLAVYRGATLAWSALPSSGAVPLTATFGTTSDRVISAAVLPPVSREIRAGDADGDGTSEITSYNTTTGIWSTLRSSDGFTAPPLLGSRGGTGYTAVPGDYDGDGRRDLGVYQESTGQWIVLRSDGAPIPYMFGAGGVGWVPVAGDYDGDGRADMIVYNTTTGQWYGRMSISNFTSAAPLSGMTWGGAGFTAAPGDFDGDGKLDLSVYHEATGNWFILASGTGYMSFIGHHYGEAGYVPVPADFDGDGITDFAVHNPVTGIWAFLRSDTGNTLGYSQGNGGTGYTPVAGDWDGDRRADLGVYQTATGNWPILKSSTSFTASLPPTMLGGAGQVPTPGFR